MGADYKPARKYARDQPWIDYSVVLAQNVWGIVLAPTGNVGVKLLSAVIDVTVANETLELEITKDGVLRTLTQAAVVGTFYELEWRPYLANRIVLAVVGADEPITALSGWEGHSLGVRIRKTTVLGGGLVRCWLAYQTYEPL